MEKCTKMTMNEDELKMNWRTQLMKLCSSTNTHHLLRYDALQRRTNGILKDGAEVLEVSEGVKKVELMMVNIEDHSIRVLKGDKGKKLSVFDISELKENEIINLNDDGRRWEGGVLKGKVFGYGCLYDEENRLEYEGWIIDGEKRCYGIEYWNDLGIVKYRGCYYNGMRNGYGLLYDRKGNIEYEGLFSNDVPYSPDDAFEAEHQQKTIYEYDFELSDLDSSDREEELRASNLEDIPLVIDFHTKMLRITWCDYVDTTSLWFEMLPYLTILVIDSSFLKLKRLLIDNLPLLEKVDIELGQTRSYNPRISYELIKGSHLTIQHCPKLQIVHLYGNHLPNYQQCILQDLPSLQDLNIGNDCFMFCRSFELKGTIGS